MKITWLGQAGFMMETNGKTVIIDPYLSDSVEKIEPQNKRRVPVDESFLKVRPDIIVLTHDHMDHTDPETLVHYLPYGENITVLAPYNAWQKARKFGGANNNYVMFNRHTRWTQDGIEFYAVKAEHSDLMGVGVIVKAEGKTYYFTGDTLYNDDIFSDLPDCIDYVFLPVNGKGNNMNMTDGAKFCQKIGAKAIPMHCGLFDSFDLNDFPYENKIVPTFYKEIEL